MFNISLGQAYAGSNEKHIIYSFPNDFAFIPKSKMV